jgi:thioredoxin reductase
VRGVAIRIGSVPNTDELADVVECDAEGRIVVNADLETSAPLVLACGDIRRGTQPGVASAVEDGARAAARARALLANLATA